MLLHGGCDTIGTSFGRLPPELARHRRVIAFEQQGYGRTKDVVERPFTVDRSDAWFWDAMEHASLDNMPKELQEAYLAVAPQPENLRLFHDKAAQRMRDFRDAPASAIRGVTAPALVVVGDADVIRPEHAVETFRLLPHAQLAILPATDHIEMPERTDWLVPMVLEFLEDPTVPRSGVPAPPWESDSE